MTEPIKIKTATNEGSGPILSVWEQEHNEFEMDCRRVMHSMSCTRYNSKQEAKVAFEKMLDSWRDKKNEGLVKYLDIDSNVHLTSLRKSIDHMVDCNCLKCGKPTVVQGEYRLYNAECNECNFNRRKLEHEKKYKERLELRKQEDDNRDPIEKYVRQIRDDDDDYDKSKCREVPFEREEQLRIEHDVEDYAKGNTTLDHDARLFPHRNINMSKDNFIKQFLNLHANELNPSEQLIEELEKKWTWLKHSKKTQREEIEESERDHKFAYHNSPMYKYEYEILNKIGCKCYNQNMRQTGDVCKTCRLMLKVREYTLNLFRDAAGRKFSLSK